MLSASLKVRKSYESGFIFSIMNDIALIDYIETVYFLKAIKS